MNLKVLRSLYVGWKNFSFPSEEIEKQAKERADKCASCPHANLNHPFKLLIPEEKRIEMIKGLGCDKCGCPLSSKLRSPLEQCPLLPPKW